MNQLYAWVCVGIVLCSWEAAHTQSPSSFVKWANTAHNFGRVNTAIAYTSDFYFTNPRSVPVQVVGVRTNCLCLTPYWKETPVQPNEKGVVSLTFKGTKDGIYNVEVQVFFKNTDTQDILRVNAKIGDDFQDVRPATVVPTPPPTVARPPATAPPSTAKPAAPTKKRQAPGAIHKQNHAASPPNKTDNNLKERDLDNQEESGSSAPVQPNPNRPGTPYVRPPHTEVPPATPQRPVTTNPNPPSSGRINPNPPATVPPPSVLPTANVLEERESRMVWVINNIRSNPKSFMPEVEAYQVEIRAAAAKATSDFEKRYFQEEERAAAELLELLNVSPALSSLKTDNALQQLAAQQKAHLLRANAITHQSPDSLTPEERLRNVGFGRGQQLIGAGSADPKRMVLLLLVDGGVKDRAHRQAILASHNQYIGCAFVGKVGYMENVWIQLLGGQPMPSRAQAPQMPAARPAASPLTNNRNQPPKDLLDAAKNASYLTRREQLMVQEVNLLRSDPPAYAAFIAEYLQEMQAKGSADDDFKTAAEQAIAELRLLTKPLSILQPHEQLFEVAAQQSLFVVKEAQLTHEGKNHLLPWERILQAAPEFTDGNENLVAGASDIRTAVIILLVDAGVPERGHRRILLHPKWKFMACYEIGTVGRMSNCWLQNFAH